MAARLACPRIPPGGVGLAIRARMTRSLTLRPGGQSQTISEGTYAAEHQCAFWNAG